MHCSVIGRFTLSPGINTVPGAMLNIHIFFFPFFVYFRGCISLKLSRIQTAIPERNKNNTSSHQHTNPETSTMRMPLIDPTMTPWPMSVSRKVFRTLTGEGYSMSGRPDKLGMTSRNPQGVREWFDSR